MKKTNSTTVTEIAATTSTVTLVPENRRRLTGTIYNQCPKDLYVKYGTGATSDDFSVIVPRDGYLVLPMEYYGVITGVWSNGVGQGGTNRALVTEFVQ